MNSNDIIRNYKHDIVGKFNDINSAVSCLDENDFNDSEMVEVLFAIHEVLLRMVKTSRNTMMNILEGEMVLCISDHEISRDLTKLHIEGVNLRYSISDSKVSFFYSTQENDGDLLINLGRIYSNIPVKNIQVDSSNSSIKEQLTLAGILL